MKKCFCIALMFISFFSSQSFAVEFTKEEIEKLNSAFTASITGNKVYETRVKFKKENPELLAKYQAFFGSLMNNKRNFEEAKKFFLSGGDIDIISPFSAETFLLDAITRNKLDEVKWLIENGASVNYTGGNLPQPLLTAEISSQVHSSSSIVEYLISKGAK